MPVPLFDTTTPLEPLRDRLREAALARARRRPVHPRAGGRGLRDRVRRRTRRRATRSASPTAPRRSRSRCGRWASGRATTSSCPRSRFYASAEAIPPTGARPVFCDIDPDTFCVTPDTVRAALTPRTKAVIAVHLFGNVAPIAEIEALGVPVLEDAAQAAGSTLRRARGPGRSGRRPRSRSSRPRTSAASATAARSSPTTTRSPTACACCASTARATRSTYERGRLQLAPGRAPGGAAARRCCRTSTSGPAGRRAAGAPLRGRRAGRARRAAAADAGERPGLAPLRDPPPARRPARRGARPRRDRLQGLLPHARSTASPRCARTPRGASSCPATDEAAATAPRDPDEPRPRPAGGDRGRLGDPRRAGLSRPRSGRRPGPMRVWIDLTNSPHVLVLRPVIDALRGRRATRWRSRRATSPRRSSCASGSGSPTRRSAATAAAGSPPRALGLASRSGGAGPLGAPARPVRPRDRPRLQRRHRGRRAAADPVHDDLRLRVGDGPAQRQLPPRPGGRGARRDPARAPRPLRRAAASCTAYPGLKEEYYLADFEPDPAILAGWASTRRSRSPSCARPPAVSLYHRFENDLFARGPGPPARRPGGRPARARPSSAPSSSRPAASSCPSRRSTPSR